MYKRLQQCVLIWFCLFFRNSLFVYCQPCDPPPPVYGTLLLDHHKDTASFEHGQSVEYRCDFPKFSVRYLMSWIRTCSNGKWSATEFKCEETTCPYLDTPRNARRLDDNYNVGESTTFECYRGYQMRGKATLICRVDAQWSPDVLPTCTPVKCPTLNYRIPNGRIRQDTTFGEENSYGVKATYECDFGYKVEGSKTRQCLETGQWSGVDTKCAEPTCSIIEDYYGGTIQYMGERNIGTYAIFRCLKGNYFYPDYDEKTKFTSCKRLGENAEWVDIPLCYGSARTHVPNGIASTCSDELKHMKTCDIWCENNHEMKRNGVYHSRDRVTITNRNGTLDDDLTRFECVPERCDLSEARNKHFDIKTSNTDIDSGTSVQMTCSEDFEFEEYREKSVFSVTCNRGTLEGLPNGTCEHYMRSAEWCKNEIMKQNEKIQKLEESLLKMHKPSSKLQTETRSKRFVANSEMPVAFHAVTSEHSVSYPGKQQNLIFDTILLNIGEGYNEDSGHFIAPTAGLYVFSASIASLVGTHPNFVGAIMKNGSIVAMMSGQGDSKMKQGSVTITTQLAVSDEVWVKITSPENTSIRGEAFSSFTGFLLYEM